MLCWLCAELWENYATWHSTQAPKSLGFISNAQKFSPRQTLFYSWCRTEMRKAHEKELLAVAVPPHIRSTVPPHIWIEPPLSPSCTELPSLGGQEQGHSHQSLWPQALWFSTLALLQGLHINEHPLNSTTVGHLQRDSLDKLLVV